MSTLAKVGVVLRRVLFGSRKLSKEMTERMSIADTALDRAHLRSYRCGLQFEMQAAEDVATAHRSLEVVNDALRILQRVEQRGKT